MKIYRFVNSNGDGLYQDNFWKEVGLPYDGDDLPIHQPPVYEDIKGWKWKDSKQYYCAFLNATQIVSWFRDVSPLNVFIAGGQLFEIEIPDDHVLLGGRQCVYHKEHVSYIREISIDDFIELVEPAMIKLKDVVCW